MDTNTLDLKDYLTILRRRKAQILIPAVVLFAASVALAYGLPPAYRSTATVLIEQQEIPQDLVRSTVTSYAAERIEIIRRRVETRANLRRIVEKFDLYPEERKSGDMGEILKRVRRSIEVEMVSANVVDPKARSAKATIAFELSFSSDKPETAHQVANEVVELYLSENLKIRTQKAEMTSEFLAGEERKLAEYLSSLEAKLADHKEKNIGQLPELMRLNLQLMERTERELEVTEREIYNLQERRMYLESQLTQLEPNIGVSPAVRLRELQTQYVTALALYARDHPDLVRLRREIGLLKKEIGGVDETGEITNQLINAHAQLARNREKYSENHPDVVKLKKSVTTLEKALKNAPPSRQSEALLRPDNPAYVSIENQLDATKHNLKAAEERRIRAKEKLAEYERRLLQTPRVEQAGLVLNREYESTVQQHREIKQKLMKAQVGEQLERQEKAERFSVIDPPNLPGKPEKPNRLAILLLGTMFSFGGGIGYAGLVEYMDRTIRGPRNIHAVVGAPPLAVIPYIEAQKDPYRRHKKSA